MNITPHFHNVILEQIKEPFQYGINDCALFVDSIYRKAFGIDLANGIRGTYNSEYGAAKILITNGSWEGLFTSRNFKKLFNKNFVKRGDIVISDGCAGIWVGNNKSIFARGITRDLSKIDEVYSYNKS